MDYKEMAEIVTKEVDAILERKRIRSMRIKRISLTASGLCAAVLVCFGVWKLRPSLENKNNFDDTNIVITTVTTAETTVTSTQTTPPLTTATKTETTASSAKTTSISTKAAETKTTAAKATAAVPIRTTIPYRTTSLPVTTRKATTTTAALTTVSPPVSTTATAAQTSTTGKVHVTTVSPTTGVFVVTTEPVTTDVTTPPGGITDPPPNKNTMTEIFLASTATIEIKKNGTYVDYEKHNTLIENERIGDFISLVSLKMIHPDGTRQIISMGVYTIKDVDMEEAVALRLVNEYSFTEGYYLFTDPNYQKNDN
jgi:cytoskeletal protein RodZ